MNFCVWLDSCFTRLGRRLGRKLDSAHARRLGVDGHLVRVAVVRRVNDAAADQLTDVILAGWQAGPASTPLTVDERRRQFHRSHRTNRRGLRQTRRRARFTSLYGRPL